MSPPESEGDPLTTSIRQRMIAGRSLLSYMVGRRSVAKLLSKDEAAKDSQKPQFNDAMAAPPGVFRQPARFLQLLSQAGFSVRRNRPCVQSGIRTPRRTIRSEHSALTDAQTILVQR